MSNDQSALTKEFCLSAQELLDKAIENGEGIIASNGALSVETGERTGRSPNDRFIVKEPSTEDLIDWGEINKPFEVDAFNLLWDKDELMSIGGCGMPFSTMVEYQGLFSALIMAYQGGPSCAEDGWRFIFNFAEWALIAFLGMIFLKTISALKQR